MAEVTFVAEYPSIEVALPAAIIAEPPMAEPPVCTVANTPAKAALPVGATMS